MKPDAKLIINGPDSKNWTVQKLEGTVMYRGTLPECDAYKLGWDDAWYSDDYSSVAIFNTRTGRMPAR